MVHMGRDIGRPMDRYRQHMEGHEDIGRGMGTQGRLMDTGGMVTKGHS